MKVLPSKGKAHGGSWEHLPKAGGGSPPFGETRTLLSYPVGLEECRDVWLQGVLPSPVLLMCTNLPCFFFFSGVLN